MRGLPDWKMALAFKDRSSRLLSRGSSSSGSSSRSISECFSPEIIQEEDEDNALAEADDHHDDVDADDNDNEPQTVEA